MRWWLLLSLAACGADAGADGTQILFPYEQMPGGVVFASTSFAGTAGYDLYWAPVPATATLEGQPVFRLTETNGDDWQPAVSLSGRAVAFARKDDGIFLIGVSGRVKRISETDGTAFQDSLPAVSADGRRVAWVREDRAKPVADTGFYETSIWVANFDGTDARAVFPRPGSVQDAPVFEPILGSNRLAWSEFDATSLGPNGPQRYGIWLHDLANVSGQFVCQTSYRIVDRVYRCFGQHLAWPIPNTLVLPQQFLEISLDGTAPNTVYLTILDSLTTQQLGQPIIEQIPGFYSPFPLSASYQGIERMIFDGVVTSVEGDLPSLNFMIAAVSGDSVWPLVLANRATEYDPASTGGFLFSVATPQFMPGIQP